MKSSPLFQLLALLLFANSLSVQPLVAQSDWTEPQKPHRIAGNLYYVGSRGLASYLVTTPQGHILINSSLEKSVPLIQKSVETLGIKFQDIKILLISHAHWDHCAGSAAVKSLTGAKYFVMDSDVSAVESGGKTDFQYGGLEATHFPPVKVDRVLQDRDTVELGGSKLTAFKTPGHTRGCTTWTLQVREKGQNYYAVIVGSPNVNPGYRLTGNDTYPEMARDFETTFKVLKSLPCDIFLGAHGDYYGMQAKLKLISGSSITASINNVFVDPEGYRSFVADRERAFRTELKKQTR